MKVLAVDLITQVDDVSAECEDIILQITNQCTGAMIQQKLSREQYKCLLTAMANNDFIIQFAEQNIYIIPVMNKDTKDESSSFKDS